MRRKILLNSKDLMTVIAECVTIPKLKGKLWGGREHSKRLIKECVVETIKGDYKKEIREANNAQSVSEGLMSYSVATDNFITKR